MDIKKWLKIQLSTHVTSSHVHNFVPLKGSSNSFNYSSNFISISINSIKLKGLLQATLGSLSYILTYKNKYL